MSLAKASVWTAASTLVKIGAGLLVVKLLAVSFGPSGVGTAGNFRQLVTVLGVLAGAGIFNGVTKYVAQYHDDAAQLRRVVGTSSAMVLGFSTLLAAVFLLAAAPVSQGLFGHTHYQGLVRLVALVQMGIAWANLLLALMKGFRDAAGNALALIWAVSLALLPTTSAIAGGYEGALLGLALVPALVVVPASIMLMRRGLIPLRYLKPQWDKTPGRAIREIYPDGADYLRHASGGLRDDAKPAGGALQLGRSGDLAGCQQYFRCLPPVYYGFLYRLFAANLIAPEFQVGYNSRDSPFPAFCASRRGGSQFYRLVVARCRHLAAFLRKVYRDARSLCWQLVGDVLKVGAYVFGYLVIAKASLRLYIPAEISQFTLLTAFSHWLIPAHGALGAAQAYMATYIVYFAACCGVFLLWRKRA